MSRRYQRTNVAEQPKLPPERLSVVMNEITAA